MVESLTATASRAPQFLSWSLIGYINRTLHRCCLDSSIGGIASPVYPDVAENIQFCRPVFAWLRDQPE